MARKPPGKEEHWQFQDGVGNIKIEAPVDGKTPLQINTNISLSKDDVLSAMLGAVLVVIIVSALCCIAKCNFSFLSRRRKRKMRIMERRKRAKASAQAGQESTTTVTVKDEKKPEAPPVDKKKAEKKVMAISKANPKGIPEETKPKSKRDLIIDIIDSALEGDICDNDFLTYSSSESIDRPSEEDQMLRRNSSNSLTLSLVYDTKTDRPVFRRT